MSDHDSESSSQSIYEDDENQDSSENAENTVNSSEDNQLSKSSSRVRNRKVKVKVQEPDIRTYVGMASPSQMKWKINKDDYQEYMKREAKKSQRTISTSKVDPNPGSSQTATQALLNKKSENDE